MKKTLLISLMILLVLAGITYMFYPSKTFFVSECEAIDFQYDKQLCYIDYAIENNEIDVCYFLLKESSGIGNLCFTEIAISKNNCLICNKINKGDIEFDNCFLICALETKDSSACEKISNQEIKENCYLRVS